MPKIISDPERLEETLRIQNFAGITDATIRLSRLNVFIGAQGSGKSVCAKLIFYFREIIEMAELRAGWGRFPGQNNQEECLQFKAQFPPELWRQGAFALEYRQGELTVRVEGEAGKARALSLTYSENWERVLRKMCAGLDTTFALEASELDEEVNLERYLAVKGEAHRELGIWSVRSWGHFIPAERVLFTLPGSKTEALIDELRGLPHRLTVAWRNYLSYKKGLLEPAEEIAAGYPAFQQRAFSLLGGEYRQVEGEDFIVTSEGDSIPLELASVGVRVAFPLVLMLLGIARYRITSPHATLFVEEPEAHLSPTAQREMVTLLLTALDLTSPESTSQCVMTTHSPTILTALNNRIYGAIAVREQPDCEARVREILGETGLVSPEGVRAYAFAGGEVRSILDEKTGLILAYELDTVSDELSNEFRELMAVRYGDDD